MYQLKELLLGLGGKEGEAEPGISAKGCVPGDDAARARGTRGVSVAILETLRFSFCFCSRSLSVPQAPTSNLGGQSRSNESNKGKTSSTLKSLSTPGL